MIVMPQKCTINNSNNNRTGIMKVKIPTLKLEFITTLNKRFILELINPSQIPIQGKILISILPNILKIVRSCSKT